MITVSGALCFFFKDPATTEIYTLPLHDALPICPGPADGGAAGAAAVSTDPRPLAERLGFEADARVLIAHADEDRKSTRLNSSHANISYAGFCLKKKKNIHRTETQYTEIIHMRSA